MKYTFLIKYKDKIIDEIEVENYDDINDAYDEARDLALQDFKIKEVDTEIKEVKKEKTERYCEGNNCGDPLAEDEETLCSKCYRKDMDREYDERKHPDDRS